MKILLRVLMGLVGLLVVAVVGGYVILSNTDLETYRTLIQDEVRKATGRDLRMDGAMNLELSFTPSVSITEVGLANAPWGEAPEMVAIDRFEAQLNLLPLISGQVDVSKVILEGATIRLEKNEAGVANFDFSQGEAGASSDAQSNQADDSQPSGDTQIPVVRFVDIRNASISYNDAQTGESYDLAIDQIGLSGLGQGDDVGLLVKLAYNEIAIDMAGELGGIDGMLDASVPFPFSLEGSIDSIDINADGQIMDLQTVAGLDMNFTVDAKELAQLASKLGQTVPDPGLIRVAGRLNGDLNGAMKLVGLDANIERDGLYTLNVKGEIADLLNQAGMRLDMTAALPDLKKLNDVLAELGNEGLNTTLEAYDGMVVPDLGGLDVKATISGGMADNGLSLSGLDVSGGAKDQVAFSLLGSVDGLPGRPVLNLGHVLEGDQLGNLSALASHYAGTPVAIPNLGAFRTEGQVSGPVDGTLVMHSLAVKAGDETVNGIAVSGAIADLNAMSGVDISLNAAVTDTSLFAGDGVGQLPADQKITLAARAKGGIDQRLDVTGLSFKTLKSDIGGSISLQTRGDIPDVTTSLNSNVIDLDEINQIIAAVLPEGEETATDDAGSAAPQTNAEGRQLLLSEDPIPFDGLKAANAVVTLDLKQLIQAPYRFENVLGKVVLKDGKLTVDGLRTQLGGGNLRLDITMNAAGDVPTIDMAARSENIDLTDLVYINDIEGAVAGPMNGEMRISTKGQSAAELGANLFGNIRAVMLDGTVHADKLRDMMGSGGTAVATLVTGGDLKVVPVYCMVKEITFEDGLGTPKVLLLDSPVTEILADGNINLNDQTIDMLLSPKTRALSLPIRVKGVLEGPDVTPDAGASLANIGASALQGGDVLGNLLGAKSRDTSASHCLAYGSTTAPKADPATQQAEQPATAEPLKAVEDVLKGDAKPEDALKDALGGLKGLLGN